MKMKTEITSLEDVQEVIDRLGDNEAKIEALKLQNKTLKGFVEVWAKAHPKEAEGQTDKFAFWLETAAPSLKILSHLTREEVVAKLDADEDMREYVVLTFDADAIKADFGGSKAKRKSVEAFGLRFTESQPHLKVAKL